MSKMKFLLYSICGIFVMTVSAKSENNPKPLSDAQNALKNSLDPLTGALTHHLEALMRKSTQAIDALVAQNFNEAKILKVVLASIQNSIQPSAPASQATTEQIGSEKKETPIAPPSDSMQQTTQVSPAENSTFSKDGKKLTPIPSKEDLLGTKNPPPKENKVKRISRTKSEEGFGVSLI